MGFRLGMFGEIGLTEPLLRSLLAEHASVAVPRLEEFWAYFRNPEEPAWPGSGRRRAAQERGLPWRLAGVRDAALDDRASRPEVVIENDIAWRVQLMVDFMFGRPVRIVSTAADEATRRAVESALDAVWEASGGIGLLQDMALLGHVFGHVDLLLRTDAAAAAGLAGVEGSDAEELARAVRVEVVHPLRGIPIVSPEDYRRLDGYVIHFERRLNEVSEGPRGVLAALRGWREGREAGLAAARRRAAVTEVISGSGRQVYSDEVLVEESDGGLTPGRVPVVHVQNVSQPLRYEGLGEVEPLMGLQDELNTRLSDRASRVTMQSFRMYLAKGVEGFDRVPLGPGRVWTTDNPEASVTAFGGDGASPSEDAHIDQVREALDKVSGVPPVAAGVVRARIGNLSSANALRVTLMGLLARTARKRVAYGSGLRRMCGLVLAALDTGGLLRTRAEDRGVRLVWPDPLPVDAHAEALAASVRAGLGAPREELLAELGYGPGDAGVE